MSTITVVRRQNEVAIAADTLVSARNRRESADYIVNSQKIFQVGESFLALAGPASADLALKNYFGNCEETPDLDSADEIYVTWHKLHHSLKQTYFLRPYDEDEDCFESTRMDVLIANPTGIFGVAAHRNVQEYSKFYAFGTGDDYALGAMFVAYQDESKSAEEVARLGVAAGIEFSPTSGAPITSQTIQLNSSC